MSNWKQILKLSYAENRRLWTGQKPQQTTGQVRQFDSRIDEKKYKFTQEHLTFFNKQKEELKQYNPNADEKQLNRMALRRTVRQFNLSGA